MKRHRGAAGLAAALLAACLAGRAAAEPPPPGFAPVAVETTPIEAFDRAGSATRFGALAFRGGLVLSSPDPDFGSLSGLAFSPDGTTLYGIADTGFWFRAVPVETDGRLTGLAAPMLAPILDKAGEPLARKRDGDAEGLRIFVKDGKETALVSFEQVNELRQFVAAPDLASARSRTLKLPSMKGVRRNQGFEAVAVAPEASPLAGAVVLIAERSLDRAGNHRGWIVGGKRPGTFALKRSDDFDVTDAAFLPGGDLLVLERRFSLLGGLGMRIRRIAAASLKPGATVDGPALIEGDMRDQVDNMEGLAVRAGEDGGALIAVVSDNNRAIIQRTVLFFFALPPDATAADGGG
jgi:hypothetical protein